MQLNIFSERLKEERVRLDLSQSELGELCGVKKLAQFNYEKGERFPDANYLMQAALVGIDVNYLLTGVRSAKNLTRTESKIIEKYRETDFETKEQVLLLLTERKHERASENVVNQGANSGKGTQNNAKIQTINNAPSTTNQTKIKIGKQRGDVVNGDKNVTR